MINIRNFIGRATAAFSTIPRKGKILLLVAVALLASAPVLYLGGRMIYFALSPGSTSADADGAGNNDTGAIGYHRMTPGEVTDGIDVLGQIVFYEKIAVSSKVNGRLDRIYVREGARVSRGQLICEIERLSLQLSLKEQMAELDIASRSFDLSKARYENALKAIEVRFAQIGKARAELHDKKVSYDNMQRTLSNKTVLYKAGGISESDLEAAKAQHTGYYTRYVNAKADLEIQEVGFRDTDIVDAGHKLPKARAEKVRLFQNINTKMERAEMEAARARIRQVQQSLQSTKTLINETWIRSPISGVVASTSMEAGEIVKSDSIIAVIMDISKVFLSLNVSEADSSRVSPGQEVSFTADAFPGDTFTGRVHRVTPVFDVKSRTMEIKVLTPNPGLRLLPGMFARAKIITGKKKDALLSPLSALISREGNAAEVYLVKKDMVFRQKVETGKEYGESVEVIKGLSAGDLIVCRGVNMVRPDMKVVSPVIENDHK